MPTLPIILYPQDDNSLAFVFPAPNCSIPLAEIARKDVPAGKPYKIMGRADLPADTAFMDAWEADFSEPDGHGIGPEAWFAEQEAAQ